MPLTPEPEATLAAAGTVASAKVMTWPSTFSVEPAWISEPRLPEAVARNACTVALPEPVAVVRPSAFRSSALPVTVRS